MKTITRINKLEEKLKKHNKIIVNKIDPSKIDDIKKIKIDTTKPSVERILGFVNSTKNPYAIKVNGTIVKIKFLENGIKGSECIERFFFELYK